MPSAVCAVWLFVAALGGHLKSRHVARRTNFRHKKILEFMPHPIMSGGGGDASLFHKHAAHAGLTFDCQIV